MLNFCRWSGRAAVRGLVAASLFGGGSGIAAGQGADCSRLRAAIQAADGAESGPGRWNRATQQQQREIDRTRRFADQLRCGQGDGLIDDDPPQCAGLTDRLQRMEDNLSALEAQGSAGPVADAGQRNALLARYNAQCAGGPDSPADPSRVGAFLNNDSRNPADPPGDPDDLSSVPPNGDIMDGSNEPNHATGQAICVRTCDGGYFPLSPRASQDQLDGLEQLCHASCPGTEAKLYTMGKDGEIANATAIDGTSYNTLPTAFKFEKTLVASCSCKPPGKNWAEALAEAEKLLDPGQHDITVTASLSDQMARPGAVAASAAKPAKVPRASAIAKLKPDLSAARDGQKAMQAPTASNDTSGIGGPIQFRRTLREGDGQTIGVAGPDGVKKRIRLIVP